jgi:hypothetical protein
VDPIVFKKRFDTLKTNPVMLESMYFVKKIPENIPREVDKTE